MNSTNKKVYVTTIIFRVFCLGFTASMVVRWYFKYSLNEDLSRIEYKHFYDTKEDVYPVLSLCFKNPFSKEKLTKTYGINDSTLVDFFKGKHFNEEILRVNYNDVVFDLEDYVELYWIRWRNGTTASFSRSDIKERLFNVSYSGLWREWFFNCYGMHVPMNILEEESNIYIESFWIRVQNKIFSNLNRPIKDNFTTFIHYPNQFLLSLPTVRYAWRKRQTKSTYSMHFKINGMEIINRRQKHNNPCSNDWQHYDQRVMEAHIRQRGCKSLYHKGNSNIPLCDSKEKLQRANFPFGTDTVNVYSQPCKAVEKIYYTYEEYSLSSTTFEGTGNFWIGFSVLDPRFKEITQNRAIDFETLIGSVGGYIGLFLGYSILQVSGFILNFLAQTKNFLSKRDNDNKIGTMDTKIATTITSVMPIHLEETPNVTVVGGDVNCANILEWSKRKFEKLDNRLDELSKCFLEFKESHSK